MPSLINKTGSIDYFGELSWSNFLDWLTTFCLGAILALTALQFGAVRPETQLQLMPLYIVLLILHGLSIALARDEGRRLSPVPFLFVPFLIWAFLSVWLWTPTPWRGSHELIYFLTAFLFGWVAVNNVRTRAHLWTLLIIALIPIGKAVFIGYYQFFQDPSKMANVAVGYPLELTAQYRGQATGIFADPGSFAAFLLILLPCFLIAALVPRLPAILRIFSFYVALILLVGVALTQTYWAAASVIVMVALVPWFCFEKVGRRVLYSCLGVAAALAVFLVMYLFSPLFERGLEHALTPEGEGVRLVLWPEAMSHLAQNPIFGSGAGSFSLMVESSPERALAALPLTPHNDFLLILGEYGLVGAGLLFLPLAYAFLRARRQWSRESFQLRDKTERVMSSQKFFLSLGICAGLGACLGAALHFPTYVPALLLYGTLMFAVMVKSSFRRTVPLPKLRLSGTLYLLICGTVGGVFWAHASLATESHGDQLQAKQRLENLVERGIGVSGKFALIDRVIEVYEDALIADPGNADAWVGLSMAICQLHYREPGEFQETGRRAVAAARRAYEICPEYWLASSQLGVALALSGEIEEAREALQRGIELAPRSSNAHYYYAAFLGSEASMREEAIEQVRRALEVDPNNAAARRLEQKLLIL
jgi:O-antigen ligase